LSLFPSESIKSFSGHSFSNNLFYFLLGLNPYGPEDAPTSILTSSIESFILMRGLESMVITCSTFGYSSYYD
jgi:hypothetical protein